MENIKSLYFEQFLQHVIDSYRKTIMQAKPGHCMKITGLAMKERPKGDCPWRTDAAA